MIFTKRLEAELFLVFANKTDIIFRDEWEQDVRAHPNFHCYHVVEQPPAGWQREAGESPLIFFAGIFLFLVQRPSSSSADQHR